MANIDDSRMPLRSMPISTDEIYRGDTTQCLSNDLDTIESGISALQTGKAATNDRQTMITGSQICSKVTIQVSSDERLKENIEPVDQEKCVEFINGIDVKTFNYIGSDTPCVGAIAQDLQNSEFADYFVFTQPGEEGYLAIKDSNPIFPSVTAVQKLTKEVEHLKAKH